MSAVIRTLPDTYGQDFLYALEFKNGVVKIGVTYAPRRRAFSLAAKLKQQIVAAACCEIRGVRRPDAERAALRGASAISSPRQGSREFFPGLKFGEAVNLIRQSARRTTHEA